MKPALPLVMIGGLLLAGCAAPAAHNHIVYFPPPPSTARVVHLKSFNSLGDLVAHRPSFIERIRGGSISPYVDTPAGIDYADGHLFICDTGFNVVHDWNLVTGEARRIGESGSVVLQKPADVAVGASGTVYVADPSRGEVVAFDSAGGSVAKYRNPQGDKYRPVSVAVREPNLYVTDIAAHRVDVFSTTDGKHLETIGKTGSEPGSFYYPMGVATTANGGLAVSDMMNGRVQVLDASHQVVTTMGQPGDRYGDMGKPKHLVVGPNGVIFIADAEFARVHLFDSQGRLLMLLGGSSDSPGGTPLPVGVTIATTLPDSLAALVPADFDADYYLFVTEAVGSRRISLFAIGARR